MPRKSEPSEALLALQHCVQKAEYECRDAASHLAILQGRLEGAKMALEGYEVALRRAKKSRESRPVRLAVKNE